MSKQSNASRICISVSTDKVLEALSKESNVSRFVETSILFYLQYKDLVPAMISTIIEKDKKNKA